MRGEFGSSLPDYERALALQPNAHETWQSYGRALDMLGEYPKALAAFDRALGLRSDDVDAIVGRGHVLTALDRRSEGLAAFDQAIAMGGEAEAKGLAARGAALAETGDTDDARQTLRRAIDSGANHAGAWLAYADLVKFEAADPDFAAMETRLAEVERRQPGEALPLHFALAKAYLDVGDFERAFRHLEAGNRLKRAQLVYDAEENSSVRRRVSPPPSRLKSSRVSPAPARVRRPRSSSSACHAPAPRSSNRSSPAIRRFTAPASCMRCRRSRPKWVASPTASPRRPRTNWRGSEAYFCHASANRLPARRASSTSCRPISSTLA